MLTDEHRLIRLMLDWREVRQRVADAGMAPDDFADRSCRTIFEAIRGLERAGKFVNVISVVGRLKATNHDADALMGAVPDAVSFPDATVAEMTESHIETIQHASETRRLTEAMSRVMDDFSGDTTINPAHQLAQYFTPRGATSTDSIRLDAYLDEYFDEKHRLWYGEETAIVPTGIPTLDDMFAGGFWPGQLVIVGARTSQGKTQFGVQLAVNAAKAGYKTVIFTAEMSRQGITDRIGANLTGTRSDIIKTRSAHVNDHDRVSVDIYENTLRRNPFTRHIVLNDRAAPTVSYIRQEMARHKDASMLMVDYLGLMGDTAKGQNEQARISQIILGLQQLGKTLGIPIVVLVQINRAAEASDDKVPTMAMLRDSGQIEAAANIVMLLYRHDAYVRGGKVNPDPSRAGRIEIHVTKNRDHGRDGKVSLPYDFSKSQIWEQDEVLP